MLHSNSTCPSPREIVHLCHIHTGRVSMPGNIKSRYKINRNDEIESDNCSIASFMAVDILLDPGLKQNLTLSLGFLQIQT